MKNTLLKAPANEEHLDFVGDDLVINFINTRRIVEGQLTDTLQSDSDVKASLGRLEVPVAKGSLPFGEGYYLRGQESFMRLRSRPFRIESPGRNLRWSRSTYSWRTLRVMQCLRHTTRKTFE